MRSGEKRARGTCQLGISVKTRLAVDRDFTTGEPIQRRSSCRRVPRKVRWRWKVGGHTPAQRRVGLRARLHRFGRVDRREHPGRRARVLGERAPAARRGAARAPRRGAAFEKQPTVKVLALKLAGDRHDEVRPTCCCVWFSVDDGRPHRAGAVEDASGELTFSKVGGGPGRIPAGRRGKSHVKLVCWASQESVSGEISGICVCRPAAVKHGESTVGGLALLEAGWGLTSEIEVRQSAAARRSTAACDDASKPGACAMVVVVVGAHDAAPTARRRRAVDGAVDEAAVGAVRCCERGLQVWRPPEELVDLDLCAAPAAPPPRPTPSPPGPPPPTPPPRPTAG